MNITSANAVYTLTISGLNINETLQKFSAEDIFTTDPQVIAETVMGVDGFLSAGYTPVPISQQVNLQADSNSIDVFETWANNSRLNKTIYPANGVVVLASIGKLWTLTNGVLTIFPQIPNAAKILQPRRFTIVWEFMVAAPVLHGRY